MWDGQMRGLRGIRVNRERGACLPPCLPFPLPYLTECEICAKERAGARLKYCGIFALRKLVVKNCEPLI